MSQKANAKKTPKPQLKKPVPKVRKKTEINWVWIALGVVLLTTFIIYFRAIRFDMLFYWDDNGYITDNKNITVLNLASIKLFFSGFCLGNYHPLTMLSWAIDYKLGSGGAWIFHFNNILLHLFNTYLVFLLIRKISPDNIVVALITAALFAVHPMHVESVAWLSERKDVLYSFFFLLSLIKYMSYLKTEQTKQLIYSGIFFLLSCLSKSAAVVLPLVILLLDYYYGRKISLKMFIEKVLFFAISLIFGIVAVFSQKSTGVMQDWAPSMNFVEHFSVVAFSFITYLFRVFIPISQSAIYPYPAEIGSTLPIMYYLSFPIIVLLLLFVWYSRKWGKDVVFGFLFFIVTIILVLQLIPVGAATMADRYTYMPYVGIFFIIAKIYEGIAAKTSEKMNYQKIALAVVVFGFFTFATITFGRVGVWKNDGTLFSDVIEKYPFCSMAYLNRGNFYKNYYAKKIYADDDAKSKSYYSMAIKDFESSLKCELIAKNNWRAYFNLGLTKGDLGDTAGAVKEYDKTLELAPDNKYALLYRGVYLLDYYAKRVYAGDSTMKNKYARLSIKDFENSLKLSSAVTDKVQLYSNIGIARIELNDYAGAINAYDSLLLVDSENIEAYRKRSDAKYQLKNYQGALDDCNKIIAINPTDARAIKNRDYVKGVIENLKMK